MSAPINDAFIPSQATRSSDRSGAPDTRLRGHRLILARVVWVAVVILIVALFLVMLPAYYTQLQTVCTGATCGNTMQRLGLSVGTYAAFTLALTLALAFVCFTLGAVIFWRRSDDWMALLVALAVVTTVTLNGNGVYGSHSAWRVLTDVLYVLGGGVGLLVLSLFPDGRFVPRWTRWLLPCWVVAGMVYLFFRDASFVSSVYELVWHAEVVLILIAQVYRYRYAASPLQRQQTKWFIFGGCVAVIISVGLIVPLFIFPSLGQAGSFYQLVLGPVFIVISLIIPLCIGLAILRYRLFDIDIIIRRTVIYSTLTVLLAVIYEVSVFTLQSLLGGLTLIRGNQLAIIASTFLIGGLFKPLYDRTLATFSTTIRDEVDMNQLYTQLMAVVDETMQPAHVSLWLCAPKHHNEKTTRALPVIDTTDKP